MKIHREVAEVTEKSVQEDSSEIEGQAFLYPKPFEKVNTPLLSPRTPRPPCESSLIDPVALVVLVAGNQHRTFCGFDPRYHPKPWRRVLQVRQTNLTAVEQVRGFQ